MKYLEINLIQARPTHRLTKKHEVRPKTLTVMARSRIQRHNIVKMAILPELIYSVNIIPIKIQADLHANRNKLILKCVWKGKETRKANQVFWFSQRRKPKFFGSQGAQREGQNWKNHF